MAQSLSADERSARATIGWARDALAVLDALDDVLDEEPLTSPPAAGT
ncbi:hypothetical protein QFZ79_000264 [Arthrobacter sp. V4I6]|nr:MULTISPECIES: hypothetical protein [unclassified Arthrobacter]MDQ0822526.1 hypothetical protein [Arthrobacter sp. V1I7]MDQ0852153.1 hypothetical protein [Arthrobacter sp. V4I6]